MTDPKTNPKFIHLANHRHENLFNAPVMIGGFYNWHLAMQGDFNLFKAKQGSLEEHDIIFIGMSKPELDGVVATRIRQEIGWESKTKLVICIDYAVELWQNTFQPYLLEQELCQADMVFVSEPSMLEHVRALINDKRPVHHIPHPTNIEPLMKMRKDVELRSEEIIALVHRYDNNWMAPFIVTKDLPWNTHAILLNGEMVPQLHAFFKYLKPGLEFLQYLDFASRKKVLVDSYHRIHTYGRSAVDCAAIGLPCVGSNWQWAQTLLWPNITTEPAYLQQQKEIVIKLMEDDVFYKEQIEYADTKLDFFSYENRKKDLLDKLYN